MARYEIAAIDMSPAEVLDRIAAGMPPNGAPEVFGGEFTFTIEIADAVAGEVEAAAERNGVRLVRVDEPISEEVEFAGADADVPESLEGGTGRVVPRMRSAASASEADSPTRREPPGEPLPRHLPPG